MFRSHKRARARATDLAINRLTQTVNSSAGSGVKSFRACKRIERILIIYQPGG